MTAAQPSWEWVEERLRTCHNYWLATASPEHGPYVRPVWCYDAIEETYPASAIRFDL